MAEVLSLVASIVQVASFGLTLSRTLHDYGSAVAGAEKRLKGLDKDIDFTSRIISQLGSHLQDRQVQVRVTEETIRLTQDAVAECDAIFQAMEDVIAKIRSSGSMAKWTIYFRDSKIELLRSNLDRMKANLNLLMNVIIHGTQMAAEERRDEASIAPHLARIQELMIEKEHYTQRYLEQKRKYDDLLEKVNSTSTLGSFIVIGTANGTRAIPEDASSRANGTNDPRKRLDSSRGLPQPTETSGMPVSANTTPEAGTHEPDSGPPDQAVSLLVTPAEAAAVAQLARRAQPGPGPPMITSSSSTVSSTTPPPPGAPLPADATSPPHGLVHYPPPAESPDNSGKPRKRDRLAKTTKTVAKGAGMTLTYSLAVALFPITIPLYIGFSRYRKRSRLNVHRLSAPLSHDTGQLIPEMPQWNDSWGSPHYPIHGSGYQLVPFAMPVYQPQAHGPIIHGSNYQTAPGAMHQQQAQSPSVPYSVQESSTQRTRMPRVDYDSSAIPAELPAIHELESERPDVELVGRLFNTDPIPRG